MAIIEGLPNLIRKLHYLIVFDLNIRKRWKHSGFDDRQPKNMEWER